MGVGSQLSARVKRTTLQVFLVVELCLSLLISLSPLLIYSLAGQLPYIHILIYGFALLIGAAIGFEIPLVARLNDQFDSLDKNVSSILSYDYVGSLVGGLAFAFIGLPILGLKNSAFLFGALNLAGALLVYWVFGNKLELRKKVFVGFIGFTIVLLIATFSISDQLVLYGEQSRFKDKIVHRVESKYQKLVVTKWKNHHWLYINGNLQTTTLDEHLYHEPMIHPVMSLVHQPKHILIIGGGDGFNVKELLKYPKVEQITVVDLDPEMTKLGKEYPPFVLANNNSLNHEKVTVLNQDGFVYLQNTDQFFDLIVIDLPDAKGVDLSKLYSKEFYQLASLHLRLNGYLITQSGNPYLATKAFYCIQKTMQAAGLNTLTLHNHVLSMGEWSWVIGARQLNANQMQKALLNARFTNIETKWLNQDAMRLMLSFGKPMYDTSNVEVNTINNPVLYNYQLEGNWGDY